MLTEQQARKIFKDATVKFSGYYKYSFSYSGTFNGYVIRTSISGIDNIYRLSVDPDKDIQVFKEYKYEEEWTSVDISRDGKIVFEMDDEW